MRQLSRCALAAAAALLAVTTSGCFWTSHGYDWTNSRDAAFESRLAPSNVGGLQELWRVGGVDGVTGTPTVVAGTVYFGGWDGVLRAVDGASGAPRWATTLTTGALDGTVTVAGDRLLVGDSEGHLHAVDRATGAVQWTTLLDAHPDTRIYSSPTVAGDLVATSRPTTLPRNV